VGEKGDSQSLSRLMSVSGLACSLVCTFHVALKNKKRPGEHRYVRGKVVEWGTFRWVVEHTNMWRKLIAKKGKHR